MYYEDKQEILRDIFGAAEIGTEPGWLVVDGRRYPIVHDVIILLDRSEYPKSLADQIETGELGRSQRTADFAEDIQFTFGEEWKKYPELLPEHEVEFNQYFDLVDLSQLRKARICDLGCGIGRWSVFLSGKCRELVLVDFSEAIFVARRNLATASNAIFVMANLTKLPFRDDFADFIFCLGVLHSLPTPALQEVRALRRCASRLLIYLYYALDNRPIYFRLLFAAATQIRRAVAPVRSQIFRNVFTWLATLGLYLPFLALGALARPFGLSRYVPLYEAYSGKSLVRIRQDVYDRFFTGIEQRCSRREILSLQASFTKVIVSDAFPYWHFICER